MTQHLQNQPTMPGALDGASERDGVKVPRCPIALPSTRGWRFVLLEAGFGVWDAIFFKVRSAHYPLTTAAPLLPQQLLPA